MAKPIPGQQYVVVEGDTLSGIAGRAYGDPNLYPRIFNANSLRSNDPDKIAIGEVLNIPVLVETENLKRRFFESEVGDGFVLKLGKRTLPVMAGKVTRGINLIASAWSATIAWKPELDPLLDELLFAVRFTKASAFLDGQLKVSGFLYRADKIFSNKGRLVKLSGGSFTTDLLDSNLLPPYQEEKVTLLQYFRKRLTPLGIGVKSVIGLEETPGPDPTQFNTKTIGATEKIADYFMKLATQSRVLLSDSPEGDLLITQADIKAKSVGTLEEDKQNVQEWKFSIDARKLFNTYNAISQGPSWESKGGIAKDDTVPRSRILTFTADNSLKGEMSEIAAWKRNTEIAKALSLTVPVTSWNAPDGSLWRENTIVTVRSKTFGVPDGFNFLIKQVAYDFDDKKGETALLHIVPPTLYTGEEPNLPWRKTV